MKTAITVAEFLRVAYKATGKYVLMLSTEYFLGDGAHAMMTAENLKRALPYLDNDCLERLANRDPIIVFVDTLDEVMVLFNQTAGGDQWTSNNLYKPPFHVVANVYDNQGHWLTWNLCGCA